ncbi:unnamed protein product [Clavelina lepadiformis]|uniref:Hcy-binding domain-containing protein n=1 Tax=Clavelina lepadiformis TaxID=159417 RepID=A0ABP0GGU8_CLALP
MKDILQRLAEGPIVGDGSMCMTLEKRGYCSAGLWSPEAVLLYPEAVKQLLREYMRAGADVLQTPCFYSCEGRLRRGNTTFTSNEINDAACKMTHEIANEGQDVLVCGGLSPVETYAPGKDLSAARREFEAQLEVFIKHDVDFLLAEFFNYIEELELCIDVMKKANKPIAVSMRIGPNPDHSDVSLEECTVRMAKAGADIIGLNCMYDIDTMLNALKRMKTALDIAGLSVYLMCQPLGWRCPDVDNEKEGYISLVEAPLAMEPRALTRGEVHKFARSAYELGVRYIGGCCGMEPHHIRAISHEVFRKISHGQRIKTSE